MKWVYYLSGVNLDALGVTLLIAIGIGASPFGVLISNVILVIPITVGIASILYDITILFIVKILKKSSSLQLINLLYGLVFALFFEAYYRLFQLITISQLALQISLGVIAIVLLDLAKFLLNKSNMPRLTTAILIYTIKERFHVNLNISTKILSISLLLIGISVSFIHGDNFYGVGITTFVYLIFAGLFLRYFESKAS